MERRTFVKQTSVAALSPKPTVQAGSAKPPNIVLILADDFG